MQAELVVVAVPAPTVFVMLTRYCRALPVGNAGAAKLGAVAPATLVKVAPPSVETCHW